MNKNELKIISKKFRIYAGQVLNIEGDEDINILKVFIDFIENESLIFNFVNNQMCSDEEFENILGSRGFGRVFSLSSNTNKMVNEVYLILKHIVTKNSLSRVTLGYATTSNKFVDSIKNFISKTVSPFLDEIRLFIECEFNNTDEASEIKPQLFLSYCQKDTDIANVVEKHLLKIHPTFKIVRDIRDVLFGSSFNEFMKTVSQKDYVIMIISDSYLKSLNCMFEVNEAMRNINYKEKIILIVLNDKDEKYYTKENLYDFIPTIYDTKRIQYLNYWEEKSK
ncbi:MAG: toll/interleukin-1 receptor domain-containing protein, partial [Clostridia bacterium]|nr:toll/interleukin-1 receptor domain-containing protein [Clostridia bacterium]